MLIVANGVSYVRAVTQAMDKGFSFLAKKHAIRDYDDPVSTWLANPWVWFPIHAVCSLLAIYCIMDTLGSAIHRSSPVIHTYSVAVVLGLIALSTAETLVAIFAIFAKVHVSLPITYALGLMNWTCLLAILSMIHRGYVYIGVDSVFAARAVLWPFLPMGIACFWRVANLRVIKCSFLNIFLVFGSTIAFLVEVEMCALTKINLELIIAVSVGLAGCRLLACLFRSGILTVCAWINEKEGG